MIYINSCILTLMLISPVFFGIYLKKKKLLDTNMICILILLSSLLLRLIYISYTGIGTRQHDVHTFFKNNGGHAEYILYLFDNHKLPDFDPRDIWQFYHPPLHHIICALWLTVVDLIGLDYTTTGINSLQVLTVIYSFLFSVFAYKTLKRFDLSDKMLPVCTALASFHPTLILLSGSINNDMLSAMFGMMSIYYAVKWSQDRKWSAIVLTAFSVGLGMMSKLTVGLLAPAIAALFLTVFIKNIKEWKKSILQFVVFGIICIPLGMAWPVRNFVKFGVPFNYVPLMDKNVGQYIDRSAFSRFIDYRPYQLASPFTQWSWSGHPYNEFNPIIALLKNACFDEGTFFDKSITLQCFCTVLFFVNIIVSVFAAAGLIIMLWKNKNIKLELKLIVGIVTAVIFGNYLMFCVNYPFVCTENMRYCVPLIFVNALSIGKYSEFADEHSGRKFLSRSSDIMKKCSLLFCTLTAFVYTVMSFYEVWITTL